MELLCYGGVLLMMELLCSGRADVYANCLTNSFENNTFSQGGKKF